MVSRLKAMKRARLAMLIIFVIYITVGGILAGGLYRGGWHDKNTSGLSNFYPLPMALINFRPIYYSHYFKRQLNLSVQELFSLNKGKNYLKTDEGKALFAVEEKEALEQIISDEFVKEYAELNDVRLDDGFLDQEYSRLVTELGGKAAVSRSLRNDYSWSEDYFRSVIELSLIREKIRNELCEQEVGEAKARAEEVLAKARVPRADFGALAKEFSADGTAENGGLLQVVDRRTKTFKDSEEELGQKLVDFVEKSTPGQVELVRTCDGYTIYKLDKRDPNTATVRMILIRTLTFEDLELEFRAKSQIRVFVKGFRYNHESASVEAK